MCKLFTTLYTILPAESGKSSVIVLFLKLSTAASSYSSHFVIQWVIQVVRPATAKAWRSNMAETAWVAGWYIL